MKFACRFPSSRLVYLAARFRSCIIRKSATVHFTQIDSVCYIKAGTLSMIECSKPENQGCTEYETTRSRPEIS